MFSEKEKADKRLLAMERECREKGADPEHSVFCGVSVSELSREQLEILIADFGMRQSAWIESSIRIVSEEEVALRNLHGLVNVCNLAAERVNLEPDTFSLHDGAICHEEHEIYPNAILDLLGNYLKSEMGMV